MITPPLFSPGQRVGLFGGSFNPPHLGHRAVALHALKHLELDWVWWLVSPQNPLKDPSETDDFAIRFSRTQDIALHPRFVVTDLERQLGTRTTAEFLQKMRPILRRGEFVWVMGADSFAQLHRWNDWTALPETLPLAVLARPGYSLRALNSPAAQRYAANRIPPSMAAYLAGRKPPAWTFLPMPLRPESSTAIRHRHQFVNR